MRRASGSEAAKLIHRFQICRDLGSRGFGDVPDAVIAVGANIGNRYGNIREALKQLKGEGIEVLRHSRLYESAAAYVTDQPAFLNAALAVKTRLSPIDLLAALKRIEAAAGRDFRGQRWGPRPLDLDIIFHGSTVLHDETLQLPHARWHERDFVKAPVSDLYTRDELEGMQAPMIPSLRQAQDKWESAGGEAQLGAADLRCVLPLGSGRMWPWQGRARVMGILNVTPDSFSDGGLSLQGPEALLARAKALQAGGADLIDVGGQSTRPGAALVSPEEELARVLPAIEALRADPEIAELPISVDTFSAHVARATAAAGADMINDVSGGTLDAAMHATVGELGLPYILMHMRGTPQTMQSEANSSYPPGELALTVGRELQSRAEAAVGCGIEPWRIIVDPGVGFAKTREGNCELIRDLRHVKRQLKGCLHMQPLIAGPSRKGFLGWLTGRQAADQRDTASAVAASFCLANGADMLRMHDTAAARDAIAVTRGIIVGSQARVN